MNDRELLELAAKATGAQYFSGGEDWDNPAPAEDREFYMLNGEFWNPLTDDGDALRLAVKLGIDIAKAQAAISWDDADRYALTRRAIVSAAAVIGKSMP